MAPTRVGDTWTFDLDPAELTDGALPDLNTPHRFKLGVLPADDFHATLTAMVRYADVEVDPALGHRITHAQFDLDGMLLAGQDPDTADVNTLEFDGNFDSGMSGQYHLETVTAEAGDLTNAPVIAQSVFSNPGPGTLIVMSASGYGTQIEQAGARWPVTLVQARIVFSVVTTL